MWASRRSSWCDGEWNARGVFRLTTTFDDEEGTADPDYPIINGFAPRTLFSSHFYFNRCSKVPMAFCLFISSWPFQSSPIFFFFCVGKKAGGVTSVNFTFESYLSIQLCVLFLLQHSTPLERRT